MNQDNNKEIIFDKEKSLSFEGETGPYVQYTYARLSSILRKAGSYKKKDFPEVNEAEHDILRLIAKYPFVVEDACRDNRPLNICRYLLDLCQLVNHYYHDTHILKAQSGIRKARLTLIFATKQVIKSGLSLLGIDVLEEM